MSATDLPKRIGHWFRNLTPDRKRLWITNSLLGILAAGFFWFALVAPRPWEGLPLHRIARALEVEHGEVEKSDFLELEKLGSFNLGAHGYRQIFLWFGALFASGALTIAALTSRWWLRWSDPPAGPSAELPLSRSIPKISPGKWGWICLLAGLGLALALRAPHIGRAIYFDEQDNLRRNFHGFLEIREDGEEVWRPAGWTHALWENRLGNNPVFFSLAAQTSLRVWRALTGAERQRFNIVALRIPVLLAGLGSLAALWWLLQLWGFRWGAALALFLGAVHPMHIDYSIQARGYAFVMLFVPLALAFAWRALRRGTWLDWFGMTASVFFCLWSYAGAIYFALALNAGLLIGLAWMRLRRNQRRATSQAVRLLVANSAVALLYLFLMGPTFPQVSYHFRNIFELIPLRPFWFYYAWSHYSTGVDFPDPEAIYSMRTGEFGIGHYLLDRFLPGEPVLALLQFIILPGLILAGLIPLWRKRPRVALPLTLGLISPLLALTHQQFTSLYFYYWYLVYSLPCLLIGVGIGAEQILRPASHKVLAAALVAAFLGLFIWQSWPFGGRPGRIRQTLEWPVNDAGVAVVEFQRGNHLWLTYRDGRSICRRNAFADQPDGARAGREEGKN